ncbi:CfaE/CblD family pilus tip adhesin [Burkholderia territorii]|uniref:CfaE/CblD family pilus tip adhesin n=1 Tax=Burkholderia territorii TaxID=1503055 RepID=UPI000AE75597
MPNARLRSTETTQYVKANAKRVIDPVFRQLWSHDKTDPSGSCRQSRPLSRHPWDGRALSVTIPAEELTKIPNGGIWKANFLLNLRQ